MRQIDGDGAERTVHDRVRARGADLHALELCEVVDGLLADEHVRRGRIVGHGDDAIADGVILAALAGDQIVLVGGRPHDHRILSEQRELGGQIAVGHLLRNGTVGDLACRDQAIADGVDRTRCLRSGSAREDLDLDLSAALLRKSLAHRLDPRDVDCMDIWQIRAVGEHSLGQGMICEDR